MKRILLLLAIFSFSIVTFSQVVEDETTEKRKDDEIKTLIGGSDDIGGYGGLSVLYSQIDAKDAIVFGASGGLIMGHMFAMGIGGAGFVNDAHYDFALDRNVSLTGGYGGMFFEPILLPKFPVNVFAPIKSSIVFGRVKMT